MKISDWFNIIGIKKELKRIRWPKQKELVSNSGIVLGITAIFALGFMLMDIIIGYALGILGL